MEDNLKVSRRIFISRTFSFEAAHHIPDHKGACKNLHGHTYHGEVVVSAPLLDCMGMVIDYSDLKHIIKERIEDKFDHKNLNELFTNPTAEVMVLSLFDELDSLFKARDDATIRLERVNLKETEKSNAWVERER